MTQVIFIKRLPERGLSLLQNLRFFNVVDKEFRETYDLKILRKTLFYN